MEKRKLRPDEFIIPDNSWVRFVNEWGPRTLWFGALVATIALGYLIYAIVGFTSSSAEFFQTQDVLRLQGALGHAGHALIIGLIIAAAGALLIYYEEGATGPILLVLAALLFWGIPLFILMTTSSTYGNQDLFNLALSKIRFSAVALLAPGMAHIVYSVFTRTKTRGTIGVKADQLQYGKGVKEEPEVVDRFLGKCWQMPYCRKFIRLRCPIYYSRKTCWRERVGCMCEEKVIREALEGTIQIPKEPAAAQQYIPYNKVLTAKEKAERCRNCVIYNEHQRQKYRLMVPVVVIGIVAGTIYWHARLTQDLGVLLGRVDRVLGQFSIEAGSNAGGQGTLVEAVQSSRFAVEVLLISLVVIVLAYALRLLEYALFRLKI